MLMSCLSGNDIVPPLQMFLITSNCLNSLTSVIEHQKLRSLTQSRNDHSGKKTFKSVASFAASADTPTSNLWCLQIRKTSFVCLFEVQGFEITHHTDKSSLLKTSYLCINCLRPGHHLKDCKSLHRCHMCQKLQ